MRIEWKYFWMEFNLRKLLSITKHGELSFTSRKLFYTILIECLFKQEYGYNMSEGQFK